MAQYLVLKFHLSYHHFWWQKYRKLLKIVKSTVANTKSCNYTEFFVFSIFEIFFVASLHCPVFLLMRNYFNFSVNTLILQQTEETAVTFIYLPSPPSNDEDAVQFYNNLELFSRNLPPTIFVHGVSTVTSTTL